ncbi:MAG TPA: HYR domain-containing protein, partial [Verrucomicrobiae bacterium]|nr:HYR domain-containing protein [Verrucomicrobiae bacterium]
GLNRPVGLAFNSAGNLFVANSGAGQVVEFTPGGAGSIFASGLNQPLGLAFDSGDNLFVADSGSGNIYKFTSGGAQSTFASGLNTPFGLAMDSAGNLYEADDASGNINKFTPAGVQSTFASGLNLPVGLAFNSAGDLFEGDFGSSNIYEFTPAGAKSTFASGLSQPTFLAFQPGTLVINCPGDIITNNAPGQCYATIAFAATVTGSPPPTVVYTLGGSVITSPFPFPVGTNVVTCIASNLTGSTSCSFTVLVRDVVPPMIDCPSNIVVDALSSNGVVVNFTVTASDPCAPLPQITSVPPSGSLFPIGQTFVKCTAVDAWGNSNQCSFLISVRSSQVETSLINLINYLAGLPIQHGVKNALLVKLKNALSELQQGQIAYALDLLNAFEHQVAAQTGKKLTLAQAAALTSGANAVIAALAGQVSVVPAKANNYSGRVSMQMVPTESSDGPGCILKLNWSGNGDLQSANSPSGPWTDVPIAVAPYWSEVGVTQQFFRVRAPW